MLRKNMHSFHIPVLGIGFSIDTPLKVSKYGISSVISLIDDTLMERLRCTFSNNYNIPYTPISSDEYDSRAKRITAYLNLLDKISKEQFEVLKNSSFEKGSDLVKCLELLPDDSIIKEKYNDLLQCTDENKADKIKQWIRESLTQGSVDVNIMTKVDKANTDSNNDYLPIEFNDAHSALRGFANSNLESSIVFSAGMNPRLYGYLATFKDFLPTEGVGFKKKITIKVSDYRSADIQGRFLAKKGLWVSEFRIESGLNCGGHAFAADGLLMGPILEEFKSKRAELKETLKEIYSKALKSKNIDVKEELLDFDITAQGGVGKTSEQEFIQRKFSINSIGWGTPFLLVPEVINMDENTLVKLSEAKEEDLYLSNISPLGVPFNNMRDNEKDNEKLLRIENGKPGSLCVKKFLESNKEFSEKPLCTASINYLKKKSEDLKIKFGNAAQYYLEMKKAVEKSCLCEGLIATALKKNNIETPKLSQSVAVCPGPNLAYFNKIVSLKEMVDHIYGRINLIANNSRPHMFIKELSLNIEFFKKKIDETLKPYTENSAAKLNVFYNNLMDGINYYKELIAEISEETEEFKERMRKELLDLEEKLSQISIMVPSIA